MKCEILGSKGGEGPHIAPLGCYAVSTCSWIPTFRRNILPHFSDLSNLFHVAYRDIDEQLLAIESMFLLS